MINWFFRNRREAKISSRNLGLVFGLKNNFTVITLSISVLLIFVIDAFSITISRNISKVSVVSSSQHTTRRSQMTQMTEMTSIVRIGRNDWGDRGDLRDDHMETRL